MKVLITGSRGKVGRTLSPMAAQEGFTVTGFDREAAPPVDWEYIAGDITDLYQVRRAVQGCDAIAHLAAIPNDRHGASDVVYQTNMLGTWNVLQAAAEAGIKKVVFFSSVNSLGIWGHQRRPDYLPIDDNHPSYAHTTYGMTKWLGEEMCAAFTRSHGISTYCLRPCLIVEEEQASWWRRGGEDRMRRWLSGDYYSYVDVRDVASATLCCLRHTPPEGDAHHGRYVLVADENAAGRPTADILKEDYPDIPWRGGPDYLENPRRALVDTRAAREILGWEPRFIHRWTQ